MPGRSNGLHLTQQLKRLTPGTRAAVAQRRGQQPQAARRAEGVQAGAMVPHQAR